MTVRTAVFLASTLTALVQSQVTCAQQGHPTTPPSAQMPCVEVRIGQDIAGRLDCVNRALRAEVDKASPMISADPASGLSPTRLGQPTPAEVKQRLGNAYGHSVVAQRPAQVFPSLFVPSH